MAAETSPSLSLFAARIFWMILGPLLLLVFAVNIADAGGGWFTGADVAFLVVLAGMLLARWWEFHRGAALTTMGEPATPADLRSYLLRAAGIGLGVWLAANLIGNIWLSS